MKLCNIWQKKHADDGELQRLEDRNRRWFTIVKPYFSFSNPALGTTSSILYANFGTDNLVGLDIIPHPERNVDFDIIYNSENYQSDTRWEKLKNHLWGGWVEGDKDNLVHLGLKTTWNIKKNHGQGMNFLSSLAIHEYTHIGQHHDQHTGWESFFHDNNFNWEDDIKRGKLEKTKNYLRKFIYDNVICFLPNISFKDYFLKNVELQARMSEVISCGYAAWQKMPVNKTEFYASFYNLGFSIPEKITKEFLTTEEGLKALEDFQAGPYVKAATHRMKILFGMWQNYLGEPKLKIALWERIYPMLYGNLLEIYGDKLGRERMGLGSNPRTSIDLMRTLIKHPETLDYEKIKQMTSEIPADMGQAILNSLINFFPEEDEYIATAVEVARQLLDREEICAALSLKTRKEFSLFGFTHVQRPIHNAMQTGHVRMIDMLIDAGADPFQQTDIYDVTGECVDCLKFSDFLLMFEKQQEILEQNPLPKKPADKEIRDVQSLNHENYRRGLNALNEAYARKYKDRSVEDLSALLKQAGVSDTSTMENNPGYDLN